MSTRGTYGVRIDGEDKLAYNRHDSYPEYLGDKICEQIRAMLLDCARSGHTIEHIKAQARAIRALDDGDENYDGLRDKEGDLRYAFEAGEMVVENDFIRNSLFCEWGYILNLDDETLEVYKGLQKAPHEQGRYAAAPKVCGSVYYPCALIATFPLAELPEQVSAVVRGLFHE